MMGSYDRYCDWFDQAEAKLKSFIRSRVRTKAMLCLLSGKKEAGELEEDLGLRPSTMLHSIKSMAESDLVVKSDRDYTLTSIGSIEASARRLHILLKAMLKPTMSLFQG
jgi:predicted transcriptional regulator